MVSRFKRTGNSRLTSANLVNNKDQAIAVAVKADADQLLHVSAGLTLVPKTTLPALVYAGASAEGLGNALVVAPHQSQTRSTLIGHGGGVQTVALVCDSTGSNERGGDDLAVRFLVLKGQCIGRHNTDATLGQGVLERFLRGGASVCAVQVLGFQVHAKLLSDGLDGRRVGRQASILVFGGLAHPGLEGIHLALGSIDDET